MKSYGSRFCRQCGKLFELTEPGQQHCASCEESGQAVITLAPQEPVPPPAAVKVSPRPRRKALQPKRTSPVRAKRAVTVNGTNVPGPRTLPMLRALAEASDGLTTPDLAELITASASSWVNALGSTRQLMLKQQRQGRVVQAGTVAGNRTRESVLWRITDEGRRYVREADGGGQNTRAGTRVTASAKPEPDLDEPIGALLPRNAAGNMARWVLSEHDCRTLGDLLYVTGAEMLAWWQFGPGCLEAVREGLASRGLVLVDELDPKDLDETAESTSSPPSNRRAQRIIEARAGNRKIDHCTEKAYNHDGCRCDECKFAHSMALAFKRAKRKLAAGVPLSALSAWERETVEDELAYREGRQWYRAAPDGRILESVVPRWVADGWFTPRRTVLEQLAAAKALGEP